ncbi:PAS domain-containing hybrid sensor histidine kinase/response regulator [uncultured Roseobacter sp.]|uniref:PAS domain-containing hybrid sensor histidine kinase/response regulator n=1 Tax=uncultured Roseobacter sp. TaxID=114847 RepID=UPI002612BDB0|nr:PAS domain-containing hybrid sensor histidine kinase/response regulator [uncultured Roseobacter sp.]
MRMASDVVNKEVLLRRVIPLGVIFTGMALLIGLFLSITQRMNDLREAPGDNLTWTLSQVEVDVLLLTDEALLAQQTDDPDLETLRRRFDNAYSRTASIAESRVFAEMRRDDTFATQLDALLDYLDQLAIIIDGPDPELATRLQEVWALSNTIREDAHDIALTGISLRSEASDAERADFGRLLFAAAAISIALILFLGFMLFVLLRQFRIHREISETAERANSRLKSSFDVSLDAIIVADDRGVILDYSGAAESVFGFTRDEAIGAPMSDLIVPHQHRAAHQAGMERFNKTGEARLVGQGRIEITALRKSGEEFPVEISIGMAKDHRGTIFISYLRDITERLAAEENLKRARDEALQAEQAKSNFLAVMSHEMRTPLNGIFGTIELLQNTRLGKTQSGYLGIAKQSADILLYHVNNVLDVARMDVGKLELVDDTFELTQFFKDIVTTNETTAYAHSNSLRLDLGSMERCHVVADEQRLRQVAYNLVSNALKFTDHGEVTLCARIIEVAEGEHTLEFSVTDTGVGIHPEDQTRVFDRFFTQEKSYDRLASGAGLGLTICRQLVDMMEGEIDLRSVVDKGSTFTVRVPLRMATDLSPSEPALVAPVDASDLNGKEVLLVEDNAINRIIVRQMLTSKGIRVIEAHNGQEAVDRAHEHAYAAILMDVSMPVMNGVDATEVIRDADTPNRQVPIIGLTAHALKDEQARFLAAGMDMCLNKPVSQAELMRALVATITKADPASNDMKDSKTSELLDAEIFGDLKDVFDQSRLNKLVNDFEVEISGLLSVVPELLTKPELSELAARTHKSIGSAGMIGAVSFQSKLRRLEQAAKANDMAAAEDAAMKAKDAWDATAKALRLASG